MAGGISSRRILICNDDGISAEGIRVLEKAARGLSDAVWVVAPAFEQSGAGHSFTTHRPLTAHRVSERHYTVDGTPTDCVLYACRALLKDHKPDLVLSGINQGANLGLDVTYSGTVGAAMEGTLQGVRSMALSLYGAKSPADTPYWETAARYAPEVIGRLAEMEWAPDTLMNVNFPAVPPEKVSGIEIPCLSRRKIGDELTINSLPDGKTSFWIGYARTEDPSVKGTDLEAVLRGAVTITPITLDLTACTMVSELKRCF